MSNELNRLTFGPEICSRVTGFECGDSVWESEVAAWLKSPAGGGGAVDAVGFGVSVWLYETTDGRIVGFGSLAHALHLPAIPGVDSPSASVIPFFGIDKRFQGQPHGPREQRYAHRVFADLISEARLVRPVRPLLVLEVDVANTRAERFYRESFGFADISQPELDTDTGRSFKWMGLALTPAS
jgi:ribosomal protein S18 acetylase RimI-like enzyme